MQSDVYPKYRALVEECEETPGTVISHTKDAGYFVSYEPGRADLCMGINLALCVVLLVVCARCLIVTFSR